MYVMTSKVKLTSSFNGVDALLNKDKPLSRNGKQCKLIKHQMALRMVQNDNISFHDLQPFLSAFCSD